MLLHLVDVSSSGRDPVGDYEIINRELTAYDSQLGAREQIVVATKIDALDEPSRLDSLRARAEAEAVVDRVMSEAQQTGKSVPADRFSALEFQIYRQRRGWST